MPVQDPVRTPIKAPGKDPQPQPWREVFTDPMRICPQQRRETASPDVSP